MDICSFLSKSYTAYHAVQHSVFILEKNGFCELNLADAWKLQKGGKYYVTKNGSCVIAFVVGDNFAFNIAGSHTDSPSLHVKGNELVDSCEGKRVNVEKYGGAILYSFIDAPLKIAGRIIEDHNGQLVQKVVDSDYLLTIPSLAIHHNPTVNDGFSVNVQKDMLPLFGDAKDVYSTLTSEKVVDADLYIVPATEAYKNGANGEFISSPRIDNLTSVYTSLLALCECSPKNIALACCFDNEEIGSETKQGANSALLERVLRKITRALNKTEDDFVSACENGFILSIDNAHAIHPAFPEKMDPKQRVYLNKGIVIKHHVNYATDGLSSAIVKTILDKAGVEHQDYCNHSDVRCGGTIGLMTSANLSMTAADIGLAQLAMHSAVETVGANDIDKMHDCVKAFFETKFSRNGSTVTID